MTLIDLDEIEFEQFDCRDEGAEEAKFVNYVSEEQLRAMPVIDPVRRGEWVTTVDTSYTKPGCIAIRKKCSGCDKIGAIDIVPKDAWEAWFKDNWCPVLPNFCSDCGLDMRKVVE